MAVIVQARSIYHRAERPLSSLRYMTQTDFSSFGLHIVNTTFPESQKSAWIVCNASPSVSCTAWGAIQLMLALHVFARCCSATYCKHRSDFLSWAQHADDANLKPNFRRSHHTKRHSFHSILHLSIAVACACIFHTVER